MGKIYRKERLKIIEIIKRFLIIIVLISLFFIVIHFRYTRQDTCVKHTGLGCDCPMDTKQ